MVPVTYLVILIVIKTKVEYDATYELFSSFIYQNKLLSQKDENWT